MNTIIRHQTPVNPLASIKRRSVNNDELVARFLEAASDLSTREAAAAIGVSHGTVAKWRSGGRSPLLAMTQRAIRAWLAEHQPAPEPEAEPRLRDTSYLKPRAQDEYDRLVGSYVRRGWPADIVERASRELVQAITGASTMRGQGAGRADLSEEDQLLAIGGAARDIEEEYAARWTKR